MKKYTLTTAELLTAMQETFRSGRTFPLEITGWSMRPLLVHGRDTVWLLPFCRETCKRGSILLYQRSNGRLVLHRVRKCLPDGYCMNGDAQSQCEHIHVAQIVAQAHQICRRGRVLACSAPELNVWNALWYPTRPVRPILFWIGHQIRKIRSRT